MKLSNNDAASLVELWNSVKSYIPAKDRLSAAEHFLSSVQDNALCDLEECANDLYGVCATLDKALRAYNEPDEDYGYEEDELEW